MFTYNTEHRSDIMFTYNTEHRSDIMFTFNLLQPNISMIDIPSQAFLSINIYVLVTLIYSNIR
jgi:hypothetical protein